MADQLKILRRQVTPVMAKLLLEMDRAIMRGWHACSNQEHAKGLAQQKFFGFLYNPEGLTLDELIRHPKFQKNLQSVIPKQTPIMCFIAVHSFVHAILEEIKTEELSTREYLLLLFNEMCMNRIRAIRSIQA